MLRQQWISGITGAHQIAIGVVAITQQARLAYGPILPEGGFIALGAHEFRPLGTGRCQPNAGLQGRRLRQRHVAHVVVLVRRFAMHRRHPDTVADLVDQPSVVVVGVDVSAQWPTGQVCREGTAVDQVVSVDVVPIHAAHAQHDAAHEHPVGAVVGAGIDRRAVARIGLQAAQRIVGIDLLGLTSLIHDRRPLAIDLEHPLVAFVRIALAGAVLVIRQPVALGTQRPNAIVRLLRIHHRLAVHLVVRVVLLDEMTVPAHAVGAIVHVDAHVRAIAHLVVVDVDVRGGVGHPAHASERVVGDAVVLVGHAVLHGGLARAPPRQVVGIAADLDPCSIVRLFLAAVHDLHELPCGVVSVVQVLPAAVGLRQQLACVVVRVGVACLADVGAALQLPEVVIPPCRHRAIGVHLEDLVVQRVVGRLGGLAQRLGRADQVAAQVVVIPDLVAGAIGLAELAPRLVPALALHDGLSPCATIRAHQAIELVVQQRSGPVLRIDRAHLVAEGVVGVADDAAVGMQLAHQVAPFIPLLPVDVVVGIAHGHLAPHRVVVEPSDRCFCVGDVAAGISPRGSVLIGLHLQDHLVVGVVAVGGLPARGARIGDAHHVAPAINVLQHLRAKVAVGAVLPSVLPDGAPTQQRVLADRVRPRVRCTPTVLRRCIGRARRAGCARDGVSGGLGRRGAHNLRIGLKHPCQVVQIASGPGQWCSRKPLVVDELVRPR
ncbi:hypothetical protein D3C71_999360 [compost metagenome]